MATESKTTIKPSGQGGDYTSLSAWEAGEQADLVAADQYAVASIDGDWSGGADTTYVDINGWTTDATRYIEIRTETSARHSGKWDTSAYILSCAFSGATSCLYYHQSYVKFIGLQCMVKQSTGGTWQICYHGYSSATTAGIEFDSCIARRDTTGAASTNAAGGFWFNNYNTYSSTVTAKNCLSYDFDIVSNSCAGYKIRDNTSYIYNCTAHNCYRGFDTPTSTATVLKNCLAQDCTDGFGGSWDANSDYNCSDIASDAPGSNSVTGTVTFLDVNAGDFTLSPYDSVAQSEGTNLYADADLPVTDDIAGNSRGDATGASFDIGASHATTKIRTVKPSGQGGDYTSLAGWESGEQDDLPSVNKISKAEIDGDWSGGAEVTTTGVRVDGWDTGASNYIEIYTTPDARHNGKWDTRAYILSGTMSGDVALFRSYEVYIRFIGLQAVVKQTNESSYHVCFIGGGATGLGMYVLFDSCIARRDTSGAATGNYVAGFFMNHSYTIGNFVCCKNCIAYDFDINGTSAGAGFYSGIASRYIHNCTAHNCYIGFRGNGGYFMNCLASGCGDGFYGGFHTNSDYNCSDIASDAPGSNSTTGEVKFWNEEGDVFRLAQGDKVAKWKGVDLSNDPDLPVVYDIAGNRRYRWDIGAWSFVLSAPDATSPKRYAQYRRLLRHILLAED